MNLNNIMSDLQIIRVNGDWVTVKINDNLFVDLSTSKLDKRDKIISKRTGVFLEQDKGFISCWVRKAWSFAELKEELLNVAKELANEQSLECAVADDTIPPSVENTMVSL